MTLGERCDEIMRLIDETLSACGVGSDATPAPAERPMVAAVRTLARAEKAKLAKTA